ncbi:hypothetical protein AAEX28_10125 [Lentisphaerota bacterium WC36G]|nr:hypothetical protein LJT99_12960 [Lentisphaerae bacterium WC36]
MKIKLEAETLKIIGHIILITSLLVLLLIISCSCTYQTMPEAGDERYEPFKKYDTWR